MNRRDILSLLSSFTVGVVAMPSKKPVQPAISNEFLNLTALQVDHIVKDYPELLELKECYNKSLTQFTVAVNVKNGQLDASRVGRIISLMYELEIYVEHIYPVTPFNIQVILRYNSINKTVPT